MIGKVVQSLMYHVAGGSMILFSAQFIPEIIAFGRQLEKP
jgi:hypothetical protein